MKSPTMASAQTGAPDANSQANPEIAARLQFMEMDAEALEHLRRLRPVVEREMKKALDRFYSKLRSTTETKHFFRDDGHVERAKGAQLGHWDAISAGQFGGKYYDDVRKVGVTHARIGLTPQWYVGGYALILDHLLKSAVVETWPRGLMGPRGGAEAAGQAMGAMVRAVLLDMELAISIYLEALDERRAAAEAARNAAEKATQEAVGAIGAGLSELASKRLTARIREQLPEAFAKLQADFDSAASQLQAAMQTVAGGADAITASGKEILVASDDLARRTEQQAANLEETAAALSGITLEVSKAAASAAEARKIVKGARGEAEQSSGVVNNAIAAMGRIEKSSGEIGKIIGVVDEIAFQTNLLALNAGVEAARAGDAGRGFAVVASEVRALAQRSAEAAREIKNLVKSSSEEVSAGVKLVAETGDSLVRIVSWVAQIEDTVAQIASYTQEQSAGLSQVNTAVAQIDHLTQQNAAMAEQATAASRSLATETDRLIAQIRQFAFGEAEKASRARSALVVPRVPESAPATDLPKRPTPAPIRKKVVNGPDADGWSEF